MTLRLINRFALPVMLGCVLAVAAILFTVPDRERPTATISAMRIAP